MRKDDWTGLGVSLALHALILLVIGIAVSWANAKKPQEEVRFVRLEFGPLNTEASAARPSAYAPEPNPQPPRPQPQPTPPRPNPPAPTPVRTPRPPVTPPPDRPLPRPQQRDDARPQPPAPEDPQPAPPTSGGTPTGQQGSSTNAESSSGQSTTGSAGTSFAGLGSRRASCPPPRFPGVTGRVTYFVTFDPNGRYVSSRPKTRGGDQRLDAAVRSVVAGCSAAALPDAASQVNQTGEVTFVFSAR